MRFASACSVPLLFLLASVASAGLVQVGHPVSLSASQRAAVERVACVNSPGKMAIGIQAWRARVRGMPDLSALVQCADGFELDAYHAYFERYCTKVHWRWTCDPPRIRLHIRVADGGPYEIRVEELSLDEALQGVRCLETALTLNPQVLDGGKAERVPVLSRKAIAGKDSFQVYLEAHNECYWLHYPRQCKVDAPEPLPVTIASGCIDE
jgi:hypothetical protein